jgi:transcriptional regulator with XRE-family HTH domain
MREHHGLIAAWAGERLRILRGAATQAEFAARLGLDQAQYNRYETGKRLAPDWVIEAAAADQGLGAAEALWGRGADEPLDPDHAVTKALTHLLGLLDPEALEDLFYFLKAKTEDLARRRRQEAKETQAALETLRQRTPLLP